MISDLNTIPPAVLDEARRLAGEERYGFLWQRVTPVNQGFLRLFIRDVVEGGADAGSWGLGRIILPDLSVPDLLTRSARDVVRPLGPPGDAGWSTVSGDLTADVLDPYVGAPAILRRDLKYLWRPPRGVTGKSLRMAARLRPVTRLEPAVRRWMAYRVGMMAGFRWERLTDVASIAEVTGIELGALSADGRKAAEALTAEARMDAAPQVPPGFRGPDSLYE